MQSGTFPVLCQSVCALAGRHDNQTDIQYHALTVDHQRNISLSVLTQHHVSVSHKTAISHSPSAPLSRQITRWKKITFHRHCR
jgi:hypothetical protein